MLHSSRITARTQARTSKAALPELELWLTSLAVAAYGVALGLAEHDDQAGEWLHETAAEACAQLESLALRDDARLWFFSRLVGRCRAAGGRHPGTAPSDLDDTPDLLLYGRSGAAGWPTSGEHPAALLLDRLGTERVIQALRRLSDDYRVVCTLYFMADLTYEEIARVLEYPTGTVRARLHRARKMLQKALWQIAEADGIAGRPGSGAR